MQIGDEIVKVNSVDVKTMKYDDIMNLLHSTHEPVEFCITRPDKPSSDDQSMTNNNDTVKIMPKSHTVTFSNQQTKNGIKPSQSTPNNFE